jgi:hypothetical protein
LPRLAPVRTLSGIDAAVDLVVKHRDNRVIIIGDFDADGATSTLPKGIRLERRRLPGAEPIRVRLRPVAGNRARGGRAFP